MNNSKNIYIKLIFVFFIFFTFFYVAVKIINHGFVAFYPEISFDEQVWRNVSITPFSEYAQSHDNKSPVFLWLNHVLDIQNTLLYIRVLNWCIYIFLTVFVYQKTKSKLSFFILTFMMYPDIPILYDVSFEVFFIILAMNYETYSGVFVGLAMIFRPYALIYTILLKGKQKLVPFVFGGVLSIIMIKADGFLPYLNTVLNYGQRINHNLFNLPAIMLFIFLGILIYLSRGSKYYRWGLVSCIPLAMRSFGHYFIPPVIILFYSIMYEKTLPNNQTHIPYPFHKVKNNFAALGFKI